jgi:hypothetical protein
MLELADGNQTNDPDENDDWLHNKELCPDKWPIMCPNERKRDRDRSRYAAMSTEQRVDKNNRRRELYAAKIISKKEGTMGSSGVLIIFCMIHFA